MVRKCSFVNLILIVCVTFVSAKFSCIISVNFEDETSISTGKERQSPRYFLRSLLGLEIVPQLEVVIIK